MKQKRPVLSALSGLVYGFVSFWWVAYSWVFIALPLAERGTKEWEEDAMFIPFGVMGIVLWLALAAFLFVKLKRGKWSLWLFLGAAVLAGGAAFAIFAILPLL